jgi:hypothetical protein
MDDPRKENAVALAKLQQWFAYVVILTGLVAWVAAQPPPDHWLPTAVLLLAVAAIVTRGVISLRNDRRSDGTSGHGGS